MTGKLPLQGQRILVVEDDFLIALDLVDILERAGAVVVGPIGRVDEALDYVAINHSTLDCVVLDINLHGKKSYPVADALNIAKACFVFATGYGAEAIEPVYRDHARCDKPYNLPSLVKAIGLVQKGMESSSSR